RSAMVRRLGQRRFAARSAAASGGEDRSNGGDFALLKRRRLDLRLEALFAYRALCRRASVGRIRPSARGSAAARVSRSSGKQPIEDRRTLVRNQAGQGSLCCFDGCQEAGLCWGGTL